MAELFRLLIALALAAISIAIAFAALVVMLISLYYFLLYVWDILTGNWLFRRISEKNYKYRIKWIAQLAESLAKKLQPREHYVRYETPLFALCFSFTAIVFLAEVIGQDDPKSILLAVLVYIATYIIEMRRKYSNPEKYSKALQANLEFLKLSFVPLVFLITVAGFLFTFMGTFVGTEDSMKLLYEWYKYLKGLTSANIISIPGYLDIGFDSAVALFLVVVQLCILFYICSIPLQLFAYFIMLVIKYFLEYGGPYKAIVKKYWDMV